MDDKVINISARKPSGTARKSLQPRFTRIRAGATCYLFGREADEIGAGLYLDTGFWNRLTAGQNNTPQTTH